MSIYESSITNPKKQLEFYKDLSEQLQQKNQELKKQLENCYCNRTDCAGRIKDSKKYDSLVQKYDTQQKEFIKYLEKTIKAFKEPKLTLNCHYTDLEVMQLKADLLKEILSKYKEIIGQNNG